MKGGKITKVGVNADGFPFFEVKMPGGITLLCEVSQDEEGNGPGFIFGLENPYEVCVSGASRSCASTSLRSEPRSDPWL